MTKKQSPAIQDEILVNKIHFIRGQKVMIDRDLAELYGVETKQLKRQVNRNISRFPSDFMFELTVEEYTVSRRQFGTLKQGDNLKYLPYAFTEQGVAMLSSVLNSKQAIAVNIQIVRVFARMRELLLANKDILLKLEHLEKQLLEQNDHSKKQDEEIQLIFEYLRKLFNPEPSAGKKIGYKFRKEE
jgi:phage regulator Rha-like protein